jgi:hypothetical protein
MTGPTGAIASYSSDFGFAFLSGSVAGTAVTNGGSIVFGGLENQAPNSKLALGNVSGVTINDTGFYQVSFGVTVQQPTGTLSTFKLTGGSATSILNAECIPLFYSNTATSGLFGFMISNSVILQVTVNPTTLNLQNSSGATVTLNNPSQALTSPSTAVAAYMTIIKLQLVN